MAPTRPTMEGDETEPTPKAACRPCIQGEAVGPHMSSMAELAFTSVLPVEKAEGP